MQQVALAMELPFVMVAWVVALGGGGYLLDRWLHTSPALMLVGGVLGFAGGMRDLLKRLSRSTAKGTPRGDG
jgi:F0F1-type ATP synthase assembly protein I